MEIYIRSASCISPQQTFGSDLLPEKEISYAESKLHAIEPDYKINLNIPSARRMSRLIKMGVSAALNCMKEGEVTVPDAIIAGTGLGCMEDSEKFLASLITNNEQTLSPTSFIFSTHNTVAGQIALLLKCYNYNFTHTHRGLSFENSLLDASLFLNDNTDANVLVGASDEVTETSFKILQRLGAVKLELEGNTSVGNSSTKGTVAGEGSAFFLLNNSTDSKNLAVIKALSTFSNPENADDISMRISKFVGENKITPQDFIMYGYNGDTSGDEIYKRTSAQFFSENLSGGYKHLCGDYHTSTAFATWLAALIIKNQQVPHYIRTDDTKNNPAPDRILIFNHYKGNEFALILLAKC